MAKKSSGISWLIIALLFALITIAIAGFGAFGIWNTSSNLALHQKAHANQMRELKELPPGKKSAPRESELVNTINVIQGNIIEDETNRYIAIGITAGSCCPGIFTLLLMTMFLVTWFKSRAKDDEPK